ncbi:MAG: M28 family peptidase, partial [Cyclobacteriaceae bacterium]|nr:M28 family peptidase [Cyclobacteriaceae bacterium]
QIAQMLKGKNKNNNYLFIAFTGEEKGLWGSNYFCKNPLIDLNTVNYMINMDMIGRLNEEKALAINGTGTSPLWEEAFQWTGSKELKLIKKKSGIGPSDHTSFYMKDIPVLHFFTGQHADYHKPADDADKINYSGILEVADFIVAIINALDKHGELPFTKTKNEEGDTPRFTVTLGVVPDYLYAEEGMRIDGVSDGKPAMKAGIISGDVVVQMGAMEVKDMMGYMKALAVFKKGDKTMVKVKRKNEVLEFEVEF